MTLVGKELRCSIVAASEKTCGENPYNFDKPKPGNHMHNKADFGSICCQEFWLAVRLFCFIPTFPPKKINKMSKH